MKKNNEKTKKQTNSETDLKFYFSLSFACFLSGIVLTFVPDFFISKEITIFVRWISFFIGLVLLTFQSAKFAETKNGTSPLFFGISLIGMCVLILSFNGDIEQRISAFACLFAGIFAICFGFFTMIRKFVLEKMKNKNKLTKPNQKVVRLKLSVKY